MLERVIDTASTNTMYGDVSTRTPQVIDEKELYGC
jgi:hypothetical protein